MKKLWLTQFLILLIASLGFYLGRDLAYGGAAALGGLAAVLNTWVLARAVNQASEQALALPGSGMGPIFLGMILRILIFVVVLLSATKGLGLPVMPIIVSFILVLLAASSVKRLPRPEGTSTTGTHKF